jgi:hypothetical protein
MIGRKLWFGVLLLAACGGKDKAAEADKESGKDPSLSDAGKAVGGLVGGLMKMAARQDSLDKANPYKDLHDPCILVTRAEAEKYLGPLAADPYRFNNGKPDENGSSCMYRAADGRSITIDPSYTGGQMAMKMLNAVGGMVNRAVVTDGGVVDTLDGDWDQVHWGFGVLNALKGDVMVDVDMNASRGGAVHAAELANIAIKRLPHPLDYDGAKAVAHAPGPLVTPRDPCSLVTKEEAAAILGKLVGEPTSSSSGCTFPVPNPIGGDRPMPVELSVQWSGGFAAMNQAKSANAMVSKSFTEKVMAGAGAEQTEAKMKQDKEGQAELEKMRGMLKGMGAEMKEGSLQLKTDTTSLKGPWDEAAILSGLTFGAVKKDVYMGMDLRLLGAEKAKALVTKAMGRI